MTAFSSHRDMLLPRTTGYALRAAACLAGRERGEWVSGVALASRANVPTAYLPKVMQLLVAGGVVEARKGWHGGYRLAREPEAIRLSDVLEAAGEELASEHCIFGFESCNPGQPCPLHAVWNRFKEGVREWARTSTLKDAGPCPEPDRADG